MDTFRHRPPTHPPIRIIKVFGEIFWRIPIDILKLQFPFTRDKWENQLDPIVNANALPFGG